jgi:hypothetical protein
MPKSISQAQAEAIASKFFNKDISEEAVSDHFTRSKKGLIPKNSMSKLIQLAGFLVGEAQENLVSADRVSSGGLSDSLKILDPRVVNGTKMIVDIEAAFYYQFVDAGVRGTRRGSGLFSFKYENPGRKMLAAILKWVRREGIKGKTDNKYRGISKREDFRKQLSGERRNKSLAYAMAKSIKIKGLKRTNFMSKAISSTASRVDDEIGKGFKVDVINSLPSKL